MWPLSLTFDVNFSHLVNKAKQSKRATKLSVLELMEKKFRSNSKLREKELELKQMKLELQKQKIDQERNEKEREAEERKQRMDLEFKERKLMLQLLQKLVDKNNC